MEHRSAHAFGKWARLACARSDRSRARFECGEMVPGTTRLLVVRGEAWRRGCRSGANASKSASPEDRSASDLSFRGRRLSLQDGAHDGRRARADWTAQRVA